MIEVGELPYGYKEIGKFTDFGFGQKIAPIFVNFAERRLAFEVKDDHLNGLGACHGGVMSLFADHQLCTIVSYDDLRNHAPTISLSVDYLAAVKLGSLVEMQVTLARRTSTMYFTQALMTVAGEPVARSTAIYRHFETPR
jgi:acyl-coenzyme A thioesterase PaaI-like protein